MHICIPDTRQLHPLNGSSFLLYNIHIDGLYHCSLRYKQLLHLHQALTKALSVQAATIPQPFKIQLPPFPPKKLLPLTVSQIEDRRALLEKYLQNISQDKAIRNSPIFNLYLLEAQRESTRIRQSKAELDIELVNGHKIRIQIMAHDSADTILTKTCRALGLNSRLNPYFCLCLCSYDVIADKLIVKRRLSLFEAPYVTLHMAKQHQEQIQSVMTAPELYETNGNSAGGYIDGRSNNNLNNNSCKCHSCQRQINSTDSSQSSLIGSSYHQQEAMINRSNSNYNSSSTTTTSSNTNASHPTTATTSSKSNHDRPQQQSQDDHINQLDSSNNDTNYPSRRRSHESISTPGQNPATIGFPSHLAPTTSFVRHRILLRKSYWDPTYDTYLLSDAQALNLLFIQTVYDIKHNFMFLDKETFQKLDSLLASNSKREYILLARTLKHYNHVHFEPCYSDYPKPRTKVMISIGSKELTMRVLKAPSKIHQTTTTQLQQQRSTNTTTNTTIATPVASTTTSNITTNGNESINVPNEQFLYCTSSLVPNGYHMMINKKDIIEEEFNFKVSLIRCWRLTSLETLNSNALPADQCNCSTCCRNQQTSTVKRKSSLFNSILGNINGNNRRNCNDCHGQLGTIQTTSAGNASKSRAYPTSPRPSHVIASGSGGSSLLAAITGTRVHQNQAGSATQVQNGLIAQCSNDMNGAQFSQYDLSFEYLISKDTLKWITISSDQAIFISISLQGVVDELVSKRDEETLSSKLLSANSPLVINSPQMQSQQPPTQESDTSMGVSQPNGSSAKTAVAVRGDSFTFMFQDGTQKWMSSCNQSIIDKFFTPLGCSPILPYSYGQNRRLPSESNSFGDVSVSSTSSTMNGGQASRFDSAQSSSSRSVVSTSLWRSYINQHQHIQHNQSVAFEITNFKKAPTPIINDAFEGVTNDDDL